MIPEKDLVKRADRFVKANRKADDVNPTVTALMDGFEAQRDAAGDQADDSLAVQAHARSLLRTAESLGMDVDPKPAAKKAPAKKSSRRG